MVVSLKEVFQRLRRGIPELEDRRRPQQQNNELQRGTLPTSLLDMPVEIMLLIVDNLPLHTKKLLWQTCRALHIILSRHLTGDFNHEERLNFLLCLSRTVPRVWVCHLCLKLHRDDDDTPGSRFFKRDDCKCHDGFVFGNAFNSGTRYRIYRFHVELALKYARMSASGLQNLDVADRNHIQTRLRDIMAPHTSEYRSILFNTKKVQQTMTPKIVNGRFLVGSVCRYVDRGPSLLWSRTEIRFVRACIHLPFCQLSWSVPQMRDIKHSRSRVFADLTDHIQDQEITGSCTFCRTDFAARGSSSRLVVRVWRDLGPEGSPLSTAWRDQVTHVALLSNVDSRSQTGLASMNEQLGGEELEDQEPDAQDGDLGELGGHVPGRVRAMYESGDGDGFPRRETSIGG